MIRKLFTVAAVMTFVFAISTNAHALLISDAGVVGAADGLAGDNPGNDADDIAQAILNLTGSLATGSCAVPPRTCWTGTVDYSDTIVTVPNGKTDVPNDGSDPIAIPGGYKYAIVKYDGQQAGWVLFDLTVYGYNLPANSNTIWGAAGTDQYRISSFTVFNPVPDGGSSAALLGAALLGLNVLRRKLNG